MDDAPVGAVHAKEPDAEISWRFSPRLPFVGGDLVLNWHIERRGRDTVIHGGNRLQRPS